MKRKALLDVFNKEGVAEFARGLIALDWEVIAMDETAKHLMAARIPVRDAVELVGPPLLGGKAGTLSEEMFTMLLANESEEDAGELMGLPRIDLVCVNFYSLKEEVESPFSTPESVVEKTDIGRTTMLRSAAKGQRIVVCDPGQYEPVLDWLQSGEPDREAVVAGLVADAEHMVSDYIWASAEYHKERHRKLLQARAMAQ